jgi:UDP-N-acetylglucosamine acyltransferase
VIHERAIIDAGAQIGDNVDIGPYSVVGSDVKIQDRVRIGPHVVINGDTNIGSDTRIYQFCSIGEAPQHLGYKDEKTRLDIGQRNLIREYCTINRGTAQGGGVTRIANDNFLMAYVHIAHDCQVGSRTIFANCASLAGHVSVGDYAVLGGFSLIHQFCRVGEHCITAIGSVCFQDVPPYVVAAGNRASPHGVNTKGIRRRGFTDKDISELKSAYKIIYRNGLSLQDAISRLKDHAWQGRYVPRLVDFVMTSERGIIR